MTVWRGVHRVKGRVAAIAAFIVPSVAVSQTVRGRQRLRRKK
jgi:hypothetical protein